MVADDPSDLLREIRAELTAIRGSAGLLRRDSGSFSLAEQRALAETIEASAVRVDELSAAAADAAPPAVVATAPATDAATDAATYALAYLEHAPQAITVVDQQLRFVFSNAVARAETRRLLGMEIAPGTPLRDVYHDVPERWEEVRVHWASALRGEERLIVRDIPSWQDPGEVTTFELRHRPLVIGTQTVGAVAVATDVTAGRKADMDLRAAEREASQARALAAARALFLSRMSHELRTPLNAVVGFAQLLQRRTSGDVRTQVDELAGASTRLVELVDQVLDLASLEADELSMSPEPVDVLPPIEQVVADQRARTPDADIRVTAAPDGAVATCDLQALLQILRAVVANAVEHGASPVTVSVEVASESLAILVQDDGDGIAQEDARAVFEPFRRLRDLPTSGPGLGLTVARGLARAIGGDLRVARVAPEGAALRLTLPRAEVAAGAPAGAPQRPAGSAAGVLLYVEDNPSNVRLLESLLLLRPDVQLVTATTAAEGVAAAGARHPDLVLLDVHLPDGSGLDSVGQLRDSAGRDDLPIVVLTADASPATRRRARDLGVAGQLIKPFDIDHLLSIVDAHLTAGSAPG